MVRQVKRADHSWGPLSLGTGISGAEEAVVHMAKQLYRRVLCWLLLLVLAAVGCCCCCWLLLAAVGCCC